MFFKQNVRYIGTIVVSCFVIIPIVFESILVGFKSIDKDVVWAAKLDHTTKWNMVRSIHVPLTFPHIISGIVAGDGSLVLKLYYSRNI